MSTANMTQHNNTQTLNKLAGYGRPAWIRVPECQKWESRVPESWLSWFWRSPWKARSSRVWGPMSPGRNLRDWPSALPRLPGHLRLTSRFGCSSSLASRRVWDGILIAAMIIVIDIMNVIIIISSSSSSTCSALIIIIISKSGTIIKYYMAGTEQAASPRPVERASFSPFPSLNLSLSPSLPHPSLSLSLSFSPSLPHPSLSLSLKDKMSKSWLVKFPTRTWKAHHHLLALRTLALLPGSEGASFGAG